METEDKKDDIQTLLDELKQTQDLTKLAASMSTPPVSTAPMTDENIEDFLLKKSSELIDKGIETVGVIKDVIQSGAAAEEVEAYAKLIASVASSLEVLNKVHLQNKKAKSAKELKQIEIDNSKKLLDKYNNAPQLGPTIQNQTNNIVVTTTREDLMKTLIGQADMLKKEDADFKTYTIDSND